MPNITTATTTPTTPTTPITTDPAPGTARRVAPDRTPLMLGALAALVLANLVQLAAGLAEIDVSPPPEVLPSIAATAAIGVAAVPLIRAGQRSGLLLGIACCALSLIGMGPHKLLLDHGTVIAPLALTGFAFEVVFVRAAVRTLRSRP